MIYKLFIYTCLPIIFLSISVSNSFQQRFNDDSWRRRQGSYFSKFSGTNFKQVLPNFFHFQIRGHCTIIEKLSLACWLCNVGSLACWLCTRLHLFVLYSFLIVQAITGVDDIAIALSTLEQFNWDINVSKINISLYNSVLT